MEYDKVHYYDYLLRNTEVPMRTPGRLPFVFFLLLSFLILPCLSLVQGQDGQSLLKEVQEAINAKDYNRALSLAEKAVSVLPNTSEAYRLRGNVRRNLKDLPNALADYDRAVQLDGQNHLAFGGRALVYLQLKQVDQALKDSNRALALKADYANGYRIRAEILMAQRQYQAAVSDLNESLRLQPQQAFVFLLRGNAKYESGDYQGAVQDYDAVEKINPGQADLYYNRGLAHKKLKDYALSEKDFTRSIELGYRVAEAYLKRGESALERGEILRARQDLAKAKELNPQIQIAPTVLATLDRAVSPPATQVRVSSKEGSPATSPVTVAQSKDPSVVTPFPPHQEPEPRPEKIQVTEILARLDDPCGRINLPEEEEAAAPSPPSSPETDLKLLQTPLAQNLNKLTKTRYAAVVNAGREAMELILGPLPPAKEKEFQTAWALMADYPSQKVVAYLDRLNPLLAEFLALTQAAESLLAAHEAARFEAEMAAAYEHEAGTREALEQMGTLSRELKAIKQRLEQVASMVKALGDPPNPLEDKCRARKKAQKAFSMFQSGGAWVLTGKPVTQIRWRKEDYRITKSEAKFENTTALMTTVVPSKFISTDKEPWPDYINQWRYYWSQPPQALAGGDKLRMEAILEDAGCTYSESNAKIKIWALSKQHITDLVLWNGMISSWAPDRQINGVYRTLVMEAVGGAGGTKKHTPQELSKSDQLGNKEPLSPLNWKPTSTVHNRYWPEIKPGQEGWSFTLEVELYSQYITSAVIYEYRWDPSAPPPPKGQALSINLPPRLAAALKSPASAAPASGDKTSTGPTPEQLLKEKVTFHQNNIKLLENDIRRYQEMLAKAKDEKSRQALQFTLTCKMADLQAEHDAIATLTTGNFTRTRTAFDEMVSAQMAANSRETTAKIQETLHRQGTLDRLIKLLPPQEQETTRQWARKQMEGAQGDPEKLKKVVQVVGQKAQAFNQADAAKYEELSAHQQLAVDILENYQTAARLTMYATPFVTGGGALAIAYGLAEGGLAGYQTGGHLGNEYAGWKGAMVGAVTTAVRFWSPKIDYALTFYEGYSAPAVGGEQAGVVGGLQNVAVTFVQRKAMQTVTTGILRYQAQTQAARKQARLEAWRDAQRRSAFNQEREYGKAMVEAHHRAYQELQSLKKSGASPEQIRAAEQRLMDQTAAIKHAPHAKGYLKFNATPEQQRAYNATDRLHTARIIRDLKDELGRAGFDPNQLSFRPIRNSGNTTPGMDLDLAMESKLGNRVTYTDPGSKQTTQIDIYTANRQVQKIFDKVYAQNSGGRTAHASWQMVTSSKHLEAYSDRAWLNIKTYQKMGLDPLAMIDPRYAADAARVTEVKAHELRQQIGLSRDNQNWEILRGTAKDIQTKILPNIQSRMGKVSDPKVREQLQRNLNFYQNLQKAMETANHDPVAAQQQIKALTGYHPIDVIHMTSAAIESLGKWK